MGLAEPIVGIVGGTGKMGSWLAHMLEKRGLSVLRAGRRTELSPAEMAKKSDVVVVSVPIADTVRVIREIGPFVPEEGLLMDLASLKVGPVEAMLEYSRAQVVGLHPLFGPGVTSDKDLRVAVCPGRGKSGQIWITEILRDEGMKIVVLDPQKHDRLMGLVQGVNHLSTLALADCISRSGFGREELVGGSTQTFEQRLDRIAAMLGQSATLFGSLLMNNPAAKDSIDDYLQSVERLMQMIQNGDQKAFEDLYDSLKDYFDVEGPRGT
jgi:prephenate dehydrogenase